MIKRGRRELGGNPALFVIFCLILVLLNAHSYAADSRKIAEREKLSNGLILLHAEKKALPIIKVMVAVKAGSVVETSEKAGLANLTADLLREGTIRRSSKDISEAIEFVGGALSSSGGNDYITIALSVLKKDVDLGFDLMSDIILNPAFSEDEINRRKTVIKNSILQQKEDPGSVASKAFLKALYGDSPYGWPVEGTEKSLDNITRQDIIDFHRSYYLPNNSIISVVGDISREELKPLMSKYFKDWEEKEIITKPFPAPKAVEGPRVIKINKDISQANIILGSPGIKRDNPDYYAVSVMNYILGGGGFASRLMDNIRDNKGLSYDVHSFFSANKYAGSFQVGLQTKNQSANAAIEEIFREMKRIMSEPVKDKELEDAKSYLTGSFPLRIDSNSKIAGFLIAAEFYNLGLDYVDDYKKSINSVSKEDVKRVAEKYLDVKNYVLVVAGNMDKAVLKY